MSESTQRALIRRALEAGDAITQLDAFNRYGCFRLGARVWELKREGLPIVSEMVEVGEEGKRVARYSLAAGQRSLL